VKAFVLWILEGFCSMDATNKDGSKVDLARKTLIEWLAKAITTVIGEHIVYNKTSV
jgi:hypothetical protein